MCGGVALRERERRFRRRDDGGGERDTERDAERDRLRRSSGLDDTDLQKPCRRYAAW